jgi:hypothetical protein
MRILVLLALMAAIKVNACTVFKTTHDGRTFIGNNEDAWSINANVRFDPASKDGFGAVYFAHYNGHPLRAMSDQMGMNTAGLVFDGLVVGPGRVQRRIKRPVMETDDFIAHVMRTCATVDEVAAYLITVNTGPVAGMLFFADASGRYLVVEPDTFFTGSDAWYALSNWRMSTCNDPGSIPIPRLQEGRQLLGNGSGATMAGAEEVLSTMAVCRRRMGEGTLFSVLFDPQEANAYLYFYHDFSERVTIDLKEELAKGDRTVDMASLFGPRPEYDRLRSYRTPFHQRWLFWAVAMLIGVAVLLGLAHLVQFIARSVSKLRGRSTAPVLTPLLAGAANVVVVILLGLTLAQEPVFYFGLGSVHTMLVALPWLLFAGLLFHLRSAAHEHATLRIPHQLSLALTLVLVTYWGMWW